jgi:hypothetical protein
MTERARKDGSYVFADLQRVISSSSRFWEDIDKGVITPGQLRSTIKPLSTSQRIYLGAFIVNGISDVEAEWTHGAVRAGLAIFPQISFPELSKTTLEPLKMAYIDGVSEQKGAADASAAESLLVVGSSMLPLLLRVEDPRVIREVEGAWDTAVLGKNERWKTISAQADEMTTQLAFDFIESTYREQYLGDMPNPYICYRRQLVYKHHDKSSLAAATIIQEKESDVKRDLAWLIKVGILNERISEKKLVEEAQDIKDSGLTDQHSKLQLILYYYLRGVPISIISRKIKRGSRFEIEALTTLGVIPKMEGINLIRKHSQSKTPQEIADDYGFPLSMVELVLSVPVYKNAPDDFATEGDIYEY